MLSSVLRYGGMVQGRHTVLLNEERLCRTARIHFQLLGIARTGTGRGRLC